MKDSVIERAIKLRDRLSGVAKEIRFRRDGNAELNELDATSCDEAAAMLQKLGTEVTRLRLGIGHFGDGMMGRSTLREIASTWNDSPKEPAQ